MEKCNHCISQIQQSNSNLKKVKDAMKQGLTADSFKNKVIG